MNAEEVTKFCYAPSAWLLLVIAVGCGAASESGETSTLTGDAPADEVTAPSTPGVPDTDTSDADDSESDDPESDPGTQPETGLDTPETPGTPPMGTPAPPAAPEEDSMPVRRPNPCPRLAKDACEPAGCLAVSSVDGVYRGCTYPTSCDETVTCGQGPSGTQVDFPSSCLPVTWETCEAAAEVECESNADCTLCEYPFPANPDDAEPVCPCQFSCHDGIPMSDAACAAITASWAPLGCDNSCSTPVCTTSPPQSHCVAGRCVKVLPPPCEFCSPSPNPEPLH